MEDELPVKHVRQGVDDVHALLESQGYLPTGARGSYATIYYHPTRIGVVKVWRAWDTGYRAFLPIALDNQHVRGFPQIYGGIVAYYTTFQPDFPTWYSIRMEKLDGMPQAYVLKTRTDAQALNVWRNTGSIKRTTDLKQALRKLQTIAQAGGFSNDAPHSENILYRTLNKQRVIIDPW